MFDLFPGELIKRWGRVPFLPGPAAPPLLVCKFPNLCNTNFSNLMCIHYIHTGIFEFLRQNVPPTSQPSIDQMQQLAQHQEQLKALHAQYLLQQQAMQQQLFRFGHVLLTSNFAGIS